MRLCRKARKNDDKTIKTTVQDCHKKRVETRNRDFDHFFGGNNFVFKFFHWFYETQHKKCYLYKKFHFCLECAFKHRFICKRYAYSVVPSNNKKLAFNAFLRPKAKLSIEVWVRYSQKISRKKTGKCACFRKK